MTVRNHLTISDEAFLADSIRCWQEALERGDMSMFEYWAMHAIGFAKRIGAQGSGSLANRNVNIPNLIR